MTVRMSSPAKRRSEGFLAQRHCHRLPDDAACSVRDTRGALVLISLGITEPDPVDDVI
jgi:hypothetical protein